MNESEPLKKCRERVPTVKTKDLLRSWEERSGYLILLAMRQSSLRWHDFYLGFCMELGNLNVNAGLFSNLPPVEWGKDKGKRRSTEDMFRGGLTRSSAEVSVMEMERRGQVIQSNFINNSQRG